MKKILFVLVLLLASCGLNDGVSVQEQKGQASDNFEVKYLFEVDGVKVYRFFDMDYYHYFAVGKGQMLNTKLSSTSGKTTSHWDDSVIETR